MSAHGLQAHGAQWLDDRRVRFRLWAPAEPAVALEIDGMEPLASSADSLGWHEWEVGDLAPGMRYRFRLGNGSTVPDPASRFQPGGVHGSSELISPDDHHWRDSAWLGRPWRDAVVYELHVGTFTPAGTFLAVIEKLDALVALGVTALQLMPVGQFPGTRSWGYDGVYPFACAASYGRPQHLKALVDAAHERGLMVLLDVVYNHFGPEGNYLPVYAPQFFADETPWGAGIAFDREGNGPVREFFIQNALYWIETFHLDGLRLDAVHAIRDRGPRHFLHELAQRVHLAAGARPVHLVLENVDNQATLLDRTATGGVNAATAQWNDDVHHALHAAITGTREAYYQDFAGDTVALGRALAEGFAFQGQPSSFRGRPRGEPSGHLPPEAFIAFLQNHDQVGNRWLGDRIDRITTVEARRAALATILLLPQVPMLFMGEEWSAPEPFPFFCDTDREIAESVRRGRIEKCSRLAPHGPVSGTMPDPAARSTFESARLDWTKRSEPEHGGTLDWYRRLLHVRRTRLLPVLHRLHARCGRFEVRGAGLLTVQWQGNGCVLRLDLNLAGHAQGSAPPAQAEPLWLEGGVDDEGRLLPWTTLWTLQDAGAPSA